MKRRNDNDFEVLDNILESVGLKNMVNDRDEDSDDDSDSELTVNWIQRAISYTTKDAKYLMFRQKTG